MIKRLQHEVNISQPFSFSITPSIFKLKGLGNSRTFQVEASRCSKGLERLKSEGSTKKVLEAGSQQLGLLGYS